MNILSFFKKPSVPAKNSDFSRFFREASSREKRRVFKDVARKASEDQRKVIESAYKSVPQPTKSPV